MLLHLLLHLRLLHLVSLAQETVLRRASELTTPMLVMVGTADPIADPSGGTELFEAATAKDKTFKRYEGFLHELFHEPERERVFADVISWLSTRVNK